MDSRFNTDKLESISKRLESAKQTATEEESDQEFVVDENKSASEDDSAGDISDDGKDNIETAYGSDSEYDNDGNVIEKEGGRMSSKRKADSDINGAVENGSEEEVDEKELSKENLKKFKSKVEKTGVIYLSRIPPYMGPPKIRHFMAKVGPVGRVYLKEEDASKRKYRVKATGKRKKMFVEGWVEYENKAHAKLAAEVLNNQRVGGKKNNFHYDDLWNVKYLPKFKWHHLTERKTYENAVREKRLELEMRQATKANNFYMDNVAKARMFKDMDERKAAAHTHKDGKQKEGGSRAEGTMAKEDKVLRTFRQRPIIE